MAYKSGAYSRTITLSPGQVRAVKAACEYLGISGQVLISQAVDNYLRQTFKDMLDELS